MADTVLQRLISTGISEARAQWLLAAGLVYVDGQRVDDPSATPGGDIGLMPYEHLAACQRASADPD